MKRLSLWLIATLALVGGCKEDNPLPNISEEKVLKSPIEVLHDPYGRAPLSAVASVQSNRPSTVKIRSIPEGELRYTSEMADVVHQAPILGLYPDTLNQLEIEIIDETGNKVTEMIEIQTTPLPTFLPDVSIQVHQDAEMADGMTLCDFAAGNNGAYLSYPFAFDEQGVIRWGLDLGFTEGLSLPVHPLKNGNIAVGHDGYIYEFDLVGKMVNEWFLPGYFQHHDIIEKPDGNLIVPVGKEGISTSEDHIIELERSSSTITRVWDLREVLDIDRFDVVENASDWLHVNAVWYSEPDDALVISGRNQGVFKVSGENELIWILAPHQGWGKAGIDGAGQETAPFLLTAVDEHGTSYSEEVQQGSMLIDEFEWPWGQHASMYLPNGHLLLFDNGFNRNFGQAGSAYSRAVEYKIDEQAGTVRQVWQYGKERGEDMFSIIISDVDYLPGIENVLVTAGIVERVGPHHAKIIEVSHSDKTVVFEAHLMFRNELGTGELSWGQFDLCYRAERFSLY